MSHPTHSLGIATRALIHLLVPDELREAFEGDLIEEQIERQRGGASTRGFAFAQTLRSAPQLLRQQARMHVTSRSGALVLLAIAVPTSLALAGFAGVFNAPLVSASTIFAGIGITSLGLFAVVPALRVLLLAVGTATLLAGQALGGSALGESMLMLYLVPGYFVSLPVSNARKCKQRAS